MKDIVLIKVYGNFSPAGAAEYSGLATIAREAVPMPLHGPVKLEKDLLSIAFEGISFPLSACLAWLRDNLSPKATGRLDYIDLESWRLDRYEFANGSFERRSAPLNHLLEHAGF